MYGVGCLEGRERERKGVTHTACHNLLGAKYGKRQVNLGIVQRVIDRGQGRDTQTRNRYQNQGTRGQEGEKEKEKKNPVMKMGSRKLGLSEWLQLYG